MKLAVISSLAVAMLGVSLCAGGALAEDPSSTKRMPAGATLDQEINQAVGSGDASSSADVDARVRDLESTRTAIDQKKPSAVSLGVSGWVSQQVQYDVKQ
jgi:hypothetical protein